MEFDDHIPLFDDLYWRRTTLVKGLNGHDADVHAANALSRKKAVHLDVNYDYHRRMSLSLAESVSIHFQTPGKSIAYMAAASPSTMTGEVSVLGRCIWPPHLFERYACGATRQNHGVGVRSERLVKLAFAWLSKSSMILTSNN